MRVCCRLEPSNLWGKVRPSMASLCRSVNALVDAFEHVGSSKHLQMVGVAKSFVENVAILCFKSVVGEFNSRDQGFP